mgnify:CR=1 FL=1
MSSTSRCILVLAAALAGAAQLPVRLGAPAPDWQAVAPSGQTVPLSRHIQQHKREAVILAPRQGETVPGAAVEDAARRLAARDADLLIVPPKPGVPREGIEPLAPATVLVDSGGVVRRIEPGRLLEGRDLEEFVEQWRLGREVFLVSCARCHGDDGSLEICGDVKPLTGIGNRLSPAQVYERLRVGELGEVDVLIRGRFHKRKEVEAVVVFVRGL